MAWFVLAGVLLLCCTDAFALNPALDVSQYAHTTWKIRDGFTQGQIVAIAQTPDGYLWLGTEFGLLRFDGVETVPWQRSPVSISRQIGLSRDPYCPTVRSTSGRPVRSNCRLRRR